MLAGFDLNIKKGDVFRYMFMPQVAPRIGQLFGTGFARLAYLIALVYKGVNILPANHTVLRRENREKLTLRAVMAAAAAEIEFTRANIDKIIIYACILIGFVLLIAQFALTAAYLMVNPAFAGMPTEYNQFFRDPDYDYDVAYHMLFSVFGVPELFSDGGTRNQYHIALHALLQLYSIGLLVIAVIIVCYFIFAVLVETAQTGTPFGRRFNHVWTPLRLVMALGLLIPIGYGLNAAQWITLYAAKLGSDFATEGWIRFNETMNQAYLEDAAERVGTPQTPELMPLARFMMTVNGCMYAYNATYTGTAAKNINAYVVRSNGTGGNDHVLVQSLDFIEAYNFSGRGDIVISFGEYNFQYQKKELGRVFPYCGKIVLSAGDTEAGALSIQSDYYRMLRRMLGGTTTTDERGGGPDEYRLAEFGRNMIRHNSNYVGIRCNPQADPDAPAAADDLCENLPLPDSNYKAWLATQLNDDMAGYIDLAVDAQAASQSWQRQMEWLQSLGWGGAGVWYNKIAQINGSLVTAVQSIPQPKSWPSVMEFIKIEQMKQNSETPDIFSTYLADDLLIQFNSANERSIAEALTQIEAWWSGEDNRQDVGGSQTALTGNAFIDSINLVFGTRGLFNMCANTDTHPLAQLSILGKGLVESSIRNIAGAAIFGTSQMLVGNFVGMLAQAASGIMLSVATITITMGFLLFYVLPFMPFLYFFFAVGGWIKGLFEAMVGVPLWALAHLRIDGEGLPGDAALDGYYLILEIFLRPILIIFGLLASVIIFSAMVKVLNEIFYLAVANLSGHDGGFTEFCAGIGAGAGAGPSDSAPGPDQIAFFRGPIDELFFTIIYAIVVYMIGMSCFKLIDLVPNNLLRYMGKSVKTFNDMASSPAEGLMMRLSVGTSQVSNSLVGMGKNFGSAVSNTARGVGQMTNDGNGG